MKKTLMTLAMCGLAATGFAQKGMSQSGKSADLRGGVTRTKISEVKLVGELTTSMIGNSEIVKFVVDDVVLKIPRDAKMLKHLEEAQKFRFESAGQALNVLASHGWEVTTVYTTKGRQGPDIHYVLALGIPATPPYSPWLDPTFERGGKR